MKFKVRIYLNHNTVIYFLLLKTVSRPGGSGAIQSDLPTGQWGSGYMTAHGNPAASSSKQIHEQVDDFGEFSQGPSVPDQGDFSQFQGAQPGHSQFGGLYLQLLTLNKFCSRIQLASLFYRQENSVMTHVSRSKVSSMPSFKSIYFLNPCYLTCHVIDLDAVV